MTLPDLFVIGTAKGTASHEMMHAAEHAGGEGRERRRRTREEEERYVFLGCATRGASASSPVASRRNGRILGEAEERRLVTDSLLLSIYYVAIE